MGTRSQFKELPLEEHIHDRNVASTSRENEVYSDWAIKVRRNGIIFSSVNQLCHEVSVRLINVLPCQNSSTGRLLCGSNV